MFPCSLATSTPQAFLVASPPALLTGFGVAPDNNIEACTAVRPMSARFGAGSSLEGVRPLVSAHVHLPVLLAEPGPSGSAEPSRRSRSCFPPSPASPGSGCSLL